MRSLDEYLLRLVATQYLLGAVAVSVTVLVLLVLARRALRRPDELGMRRLPGLLAVLTIAFVVFNVWATFANSPTGDEPHYLLMTQTLLLDADFDLRNGYQQRQYLAFYPPVHELQPHVWIKDGHWYPWHGIGLPVLSAPFFAIGGRAGVVAMLTLATVAGLGVLWSLVVRSGFRPGVATQVVLVTGLTLPLASLSAQVFEEVPAFLLISLALRSALAPVLTAAELGWLMLGVVGLPWLHAKYELLAVILVVIAFALHRDRPRVRLLIPAGALAVSVFGLALLSYNWYGLPMPGAQFLLSSSFGNPLVGLPGNLFDQQSGILFVSPVWALAIPGLLELRRQAGALAAGLASIVAVVLVLAGTHGEWYGGESSPARYWTPALPALALGLASALTNATTRRRRVFTALAMPSLVFAYALVAIPAGSVRYGDPATHHNFFIGLLERTLGVDLTWLFPSFRTLEPVVWLTTLVYMLTFAGAWRMSSKATRVRA